jgi:hypothetical protein
VAPLLLPPPLFTPTLFYSTYCLYSLPQHHPRSLESAQASLFSSRCIGCFPYIYIHPPSVYTLPGSAVVTSPLDIPTAVTLSRRKSGRSSFDRSTCLNHLPPTPFLPYRAHKPAFCGVAIVLDPFVLVLPSIISTLCACSPSMDTFFYQSVPHERYLQSPFPVRPLSRSAHPYQLSISFSFLLPEWERHSSRSSLKYPTTAR